MMRIRMGDPTHRTIVDDEALDQLLIGRMVLGRYCVEKLLGLGSTGAVYRLKHAELPDTFAALKVLFVEGGLVTGAEAKERFKQEAMIAASVGSHRVARPMDVGEFP